MFLTADIAAPHGQEGRETKNITMCARVYRPPPPAAGLASSFFLNQVFTCVPLRKKKGHANNTLFEPLFSFF
jgi:hypothetical protein